MIKKLIITESSLKGGSLGGSLDIKVGPNRTYEYEEIPVALMNKIKDVIYEYVQKDIDNISDGSAEYVEKELLKDTDKVMQSDF